MLFVYLLCPVYFNFISCMIEVTKIYVILRRENYPGMGMEKFFVLFWKLL